MKETEINETEIFYKKQIPPFTNISLQFTGIGHLVLHGNGLIDYICKTYNLNIKSLPFHTIKHATNFLIQNLSASGFDVVTIFNEYTECLYMQTCLKYLNTFYECKKISEIDNYIKNERIALVLGSTSLESKDFLYKCACRNLYIGFLSSMEFKIPFVYAFVYSPCDIKNKNSDLFNLRKEEQGMESIFNSLNEEFKNIKLENNVYHIKLEDLERNNAENIKLLENDLNKELLKFNCNLEIIADKFKNDNLYFGNTKEDIPLNLCSKILSYLKYSKDIKFDGRILFTDGIILQKKENLNNTFIFNKTPIKEYKLEKLELDYLVHFRQKSEKSSVIHLRNMQKSAESLFNGKLLFAPIVKKSEIKIKKISKKQKLIIEENEKRIQEVKKQQDLIFLRNFFQRYKKADQQTKKVLLEGINSENENIYKRILLLKIEYYSDIWNLEKRSDNCKNEVIIPCYVNCLEYIDKYLQEDNQSEYVLQKLIDCGFEATVHEIIEKRKLKFNLNFYTDDTSAPSDYDICFQLKYTGDKLKRNLGSKEDNRVLFEPDAWQRRLLDIVDEKKSAVVAAPTSSGKTFICFYAIENVMRNSDTDMVIFCLPTKALANQVSADIYARFAPKVNCKTNIQGSLMKDFSNDPFNCQVLITIPSLLESILNDPPIDLRRIRYIIIDEVHKISSEEMGSPIERIFHLSPCPMLVLSATLGNLDGFYNWMSKIENSKKRECELVLHKERYCELKPYVFSEKIVPINNLFAYSYEHIKKFGFGNDINFLPEELLLLFDSICAVLTQKQKELLLPLVPENFFKSNILTKKAVKDYQKHLLVYFESLVKNNNLNEKQVHKMYKLLTKESKKAFDKLDRFDEEYILDNVVNVLDDLKNKNMLPCIVFNTDRDFVNKMASHVYKHLEACDNEIRKNKLLDKFKKEAKRNRDAEKTKDSWIEESLEAEKSFSLKTDKKNIKYTYLDPVYKVTDFELEEETRYIKNTSPEYIGMLFRGIGVHHEQMNRKYRNVSEILFRKKHLRVLFATDTLALGINMPCRTVVFAGDTLLLDPLNYKQMAGRAGRRGYDTLGNVVFMGIPQRRVQNLLVSMLPNIKGVYTYTNTSFIGFNIENSLINYPLLENTYGMENGMDSKQGDFGLNNNRKELYCDLDRNEQAYYKNNIYDYDLRNIFTSETNRRNLVNIQKDLLHKFFSPNSYLNDLVISNRESDPSIFVFAILLELGVVNFESKEFMITLCSLFEVRPLLFPTDCILPPLSSDIYSVCRVINNMAIEATNQIYNPVLRNLQAYSNKSIHTLLSFIHVPYLDMNKNSYLYDFYINGNVKKIVLMNNIRSADLFKSLSTIDNVLVSLISWYTKYDIDKNVLREISMFYGGFSTRFKAIFA